MTPVFTCGWECGDVSGLIHWNAIGSPAISTTTVRSGARSLRCNPTASTAGVGARGNLHSSQTRHIGRFYIRFATLPSADTALAIFDQASSAGPNVRFKQSDSKIYAAVDTTFGASGVSVTTGQWYLIDYDFNVNTSGADFCDVQVGGTACGQATGTGTSGGSTGDAFGILTTCTADAFYDDLILSSTSTDYPIGAGYVNHFVPTADGTHNVASTNDFERTLTGTDIDNTTTTAFQLVDDVPLDTGTPTDFINLIAPPNATDYVEVVFGPAPGVSTPTVGPRAVEVIVVSAALSTGTNNLRLALNDNGSLDDVRNATVGSTTCVYDRKHYADPPSAASAWGVVSGNGNFNNVRMRCFTSDANPDPYFVGAMIEAEFPDNLPPVFHGLPDGKIGQCQMKQLLAT